MWDPREATSVMTIAGHECNVTDVATFPAGGMLGTTGDDGSCRVWDLRFHGTKEGPQLLQLRRTSRVSVTMSRTQGKVK